MDVESFPSQNDRDGPGLCGLLNIRCWVHWSTEHGPIHCQQVCCQRYDGGLVHGAKVRSARDTRSCLTCKYQKIFYFRQEKPKHHVHLMTVSPFIVDTGMVRASKIRFPGIDICLRWNKDIQIHNNGCTSIQARSFALRVL